MFSKVVMLFLFQLFVSNLFSQLDLRKVDYSKVDKHVLAVSKTYESDIYRLVDKLAIFDDKHLNFRAAFFWIASNIKYDCVDYHKPDKYKKNQGWRRTLVDSSGICGGYANLLKAMCDRMNIECEVIIGLARGSWKSLDSRSGESHGWNRVKLYGKWYLTDPTWASGYIDERGRIFTKAFNEHYFISNPEAFALDHFPKESKWQLLESPISYTQFVRSPIIRVRQGINPITSFYPLNGIVTISHKQKMKFSYLLKEGEKPRWITMRIAKRNDYLKAKEFTDKNSKTIDLVLKPGKKKGEYYVDFEINEPGEYFIVHYLGNDMIFQYYYKLR